MTYQPVVPMSGYAGWQFLNRTMEKQKAAYVESATVQRAETYFRENIGNITSAEQLVSDHRLLETSLKAFGLEDDLYAKAFIQEILEQGTIEDDALANKLTDKRYAAFSEAFGFGNFDTPNTVMSDFADTILERFEDRSFETAIGEVDNDMRLALNLSSALEDITTDSTTQNAQWYGVMGNTAVRSVFETAMGFSSSFGAIDIDKQLTQFKERSERMFGTSDVSDFNDPEIQEKLIRLYFVRSEINSYSATSSSSIALTLLGG